jgi:hypothetical protein
VKKLTYIGPHAEVEIEVAPNKWAEVKRNSAIEVGDSLAESLLEQPDNWKPAKSTKSQQED